MKINEKSHRHLRHHMEHFDSITQQEIVPDPMDKSKKSASEGEYKHSSFKEAVRGGYSPQIDKFFENTNPMIGPEQSIRPNDDSGSTFFEVPQEGNAKMTDEEKFNISNLMPTEVNKDWFEDVQGSVKTSHLLNVYRPVGVNTVQSSLQNAYRDYRGEPTITKNMVGPWMQSSIEPDNNIKAGALC